jgi:hypothetical protein
MNTFAKLGYLVSVAAVFAASVYFLRGDAPPPTGNIRVAARLDEFTRANPDSENTIPGFLGSPGRLGVAPATAPGDPNEAPPIPVESVKPISESDLKQGFCTASTIRLIRLQYPGLYDDIPDPDLMKSVLKQHPEYRDRICVLPVWVTAQPHDIVKYSLASVSSSTIPRSVLYYASGITVGFAIGLGLLISKIAS